MARSFACTFDYRCPFARNVHEALVVGLREGRDWDIDFKAFSLDQVHVAEGEPPVWEREPAERGSGVRALEYAIVARDIFPATFLEFHLGAFAARHDQGLRLHEQEVLDDVARRAGLDPEAVHAEVEAGWPLKKLAAEHTEAVERWSVFGVPTFIDLTLTEGADAIFVRLMERGRADDVQRVLDMLDFERLNEFKRTRILR